MAVQRLKRVRGNAENFSESGCIFFSDVGLWHRDLFGWLRKQRKLSFIRSKHLLPGIKRDFSSPLYSVNQDQSSIKSGFQGRLKFIYIVVRYGTLGKYSVQSTLR